MTQKGIFYLSLGFLLSGVWFVSVFQGCAKLLMNAAISSGLAVNSELAVSTVSVAINNNAGSILAQIPSRKIERTFAEFLERVGDALNSLRVAIGSSVLCTAGALSPSYSGSAASP
jgi:hypothetical protein